MYEFEYTNSLCGQDPDSIINFIDEELPLIKDNKRNLVLFAYSQSKKGKLIFLDFKRILNEIERMSVEIEFLERNKEYYIKIKEKQEIK